MLDEVLYLQARIFRMFIERTGLTSKDANHVFNQNGIWTFLSQCYDYLHLEGDELVLGDVMKRLEHMGVTG